MTQGEYQQFLSRTAKHEGDAEPDGAHGGVDDESELHADIREYCKRRGWIALTGSMAHRAMRTIGEFDFTVIADQGRVFFVEAKTAKGKLTPEQDGLHMIAKILGHEKRVSVVRSMDDFRKIVE